MAGGPKCREALDLLHEYLRQELTPEHMHRITDHLEKCRPCFTQAQFERSYLLMLEAKAKGQCCPDQLRLRILAALRSSDQPN
ncbi:MAG TPA: zf-HC2 domain-containing protein [Gemmatimonadales bacterium]|nr:zf-HC2 domain-containing protein [Gemmatimonadales bacterium]